MSEIETIGTFGDGMELLEGELNATSEDTFAQQFREICSCKTARSTVGIVYVWFTQKPIPRLKGESPVVYIGKTDQSFRDRHFRYAAVEASNSNLVKYRHIIQTYGPIRIACRAVEKPRDAERKLLDSYVKDHLELPPINASC